MAREPAEKKPKAPPAPEQTAEQISDAQRKVLWAKHKGRFRVLQKQQKDANKAVLDFGKIVKSDLGDFALDTIKLALKMEKSDEAQGAEIDRMHFVLKAMEWEGVPVGFQASLLGDQTAEEKAYTAGKRTGERGEAMSAPTEYATGDAYQEWCKGWHAGQEKIFNIKAGPKPKDEEKPDDESGDDDGDDENVEGEDGDDDGDAPIDGETLPADPAAVESQPARH